MKLTRKDLEIIISKSIARINLINQHTTNDIADKWVMSCIENNVTPDEFFDAIGQSKDDPIYLVVKGKFSNLQSQ
ncbi:MAG: hypothetical protein OXI43_08745 [Candidatus Poribacteria bacterium]|nr:hypothetical protein [Candidatus Poribacteria bacterium]